MRNIFMISILAFKRGSSGNNSIVATFTDIIFYKTHQNINRCFFFQSWKVAMGCPQYNGLSNDRQCHSD